MTILSISFKKKNLVTVLAYFFAIHNLKKTIDG